MMLFSPDTTYLFSCKGRGDGLEGGEAPFQKYFPLSCWERGIKGVR
jgi:hypothetical protein